MLEKMHSSVLPMMRTKTYRKEGSNGLFLRCKEAKCYTVVAYLCQDIRSSRSFLLILQFSFVIVAGEASLNVR